MTFPSNFAFEVDEMYQRTKTHEDGRNCEWVIQESLVLDLNIKNDMHILSHLVIASICVLHT